MFHSFIAYYHLALLASVPLLFLGFGQTFVQAEPIKLNWDAVEGISRYSVEVKSGTTNYVELVAGPETEQIVMVPNDRKPHCYRVRSVSSIGSKSGASRLLCITELPIVPVPNADMK